MSLRTYDNSNSPRVVTTINERQVTSAPATGQRIVVLGFSNNPSLPVQELFPTNPGTVDAVDLIRSTYNVKYPSVGTFATKAALDLTPATAGSYATVKGDGANDGVYERSAGVWSISTVLEKDLNFTYPSEVSNAIEVLVAGGSTNIQVINLGAVDRMLDLTSRMARERYIALENAYSLIVDLPIDRINAINVVSGLRGDGQYNENIDSLTVGSGVEVVYDVDEYDAASSSEKNLSTVPGYVKILDEAYDKAPVAGGENLVYQLADVCFKITTNGTLCTSVARTLSPLEFKYLTKVDFTVTGDTTFFNGIPSTAINANTWAIAKGFNNATVGGEDYAVIAKDADVVLEEIEANASLVASTGGLKANVKETTPQSFAFNAVDALTEVQWQVLYGDPTTSHMQKWLRMLNSFGDNVDASLKEGGVSIVDYQDQDTVTSSNGETPDNYLMFASSTSEQPLSYLDSVIVKDENNKNMDIGYLLDRLVTNSSFTAQFPGTTIVGKRFTYLAGEGQIFGWYNSLAKNIATTRQQTNILGPLGTISAKSASDLTRNGYQVFFSQDGSYLLNRDITAGLFLNDVARTDIINRITGNVVKDAISVAFLEGQKLLGKLLSGKANEGLKQKLEQEFARWAHPEDGRFRAPAIVEVFSNGTSSVIAVVTIVLTLFVAGEVLEIRIPVNVA